MAFLFSFKLFTELGIDYIYEQTSDMFLWQVPESKDWYDGRKNG